ncbi:MAG: glycosyltransferase family 87 protein [Chloroflexota bacterium]
MQAKIAEEAEKIDPQTSERDTAGTRPRPNVTRLAALAVLAALFAVSALSWVRFSESAGSVAGLFTQTDFPAVTITSRLISEGRGAEMYNLDVQLEGQKRLIAEGYLILSPTDGLHYPYPYTPPIAVFMSAFAGLPPTTGMAIWDLINIAALAAGFWYLLSTLPLRRFARLALLIGALTSFPFVVNLEQGQSSGVVMLGFALGIGLLKKGRDIPAGLAFGLLVLKIQWLPVLVLVLLWKRRWRTLAGIAGGAGAIMLISVLVAGTGWLPDYLHILGRAQQYARELLLDPWYSHSFPGGLAALIGPSSDDAVRFANVALTVLLVGLLVYLWRGKWQPSSARWDGLMGATVLVALFTNLQLNTHDLCLVALPAALGLSYLRRQQQATAYRTAWYALCWTIYIATGLFLPQVFSLPVRLTTLVIALMLGIMAYTLANKQQGAVREQAQS